MLFLMVVLSLTWASMSFATTTDDEVRARLILDLIDDLWRADSSESTVTMRVVTANYRRTVTMQNWTLGKNYSLVRIVSPQKEKGTATLKSGNVIYTYLPKTDRTIRLTSGMMMGSWMGSHFTNDDLVKESRMADDYIPRLGFEGDREGRSILEFILEPKPEAPVVWGRVVITVLAESYLPLVSLYYDEDLSLVRTVTFSDFVEMGGRTLPARLRVVPTEEPDEYTELIYEDIRFGVLVPESFFSLQQLRRQ
ncbi:MAG: outer membrane lipoprotein-sorting protein [Proteobacteria bacterium]|nr:outer membrane lipoprotein-sorting protein [Pseudomonadota bacterium]MBU1686699.1 outer membrane lipoprotein-sorting protein [Pseudomonadota bacterium]